ncbi:MAG TPA: flagellar hook-basal body complex protein FliE [Nitrospiria bacterium]|nr:flagellar hook-basal body complex protein FliE [Nitrospiria bacterium]
MDVHGIGPQAPVQKPADLTEDSSKADGSFVDTLKDSIRDINQIQIQAEQAIADVVGGNKQDLHQTMVAIEKADVSFQLMMQVRNKIISAYEEILRMQI